MSLTQTRQLYGLPRTETRNRGDAYDQPSQSYIMDGLHTTPIHCLQIPTDDAGGETLVKPTGIRQLASYNWANENSPTIIVPGCPPIWQNIPTPFRLPPDNGHSFSNQNRHRMSKYPLLPLVSALDHMSPDYNLSSADIVTDRNNLRKLLQWIEGPRIPDFRMDLQLAGDKSVLFTRWDANSIHHPTDRKSLVYGLNFERHCTKLYKDCGKSTGHHRIITYEYGGLRILLRFSVNACFLYDKETQEIKLPDEIQLIKKLFKRREIDLISAMEGLSTDEDIQIRDGGLLVSQSSLVEMTTRSQQSLARGFGWNRDFPQLFLSQTPHHFLGEHERGLFRRIHKRTLEDTELVEQQRKQQPAFNKLAVLLKQIRELMIQMGKERRLSLVYRAQTGKLEIFERTSSEDALPSKWMQRFRTTSPEPLTDDNINAQSDIGDLYPPSGPDDDSETESFRTANESDTD